MVGKGFRFYVVEHVGDRFSVQTNPAGGGLLLNIPFDDTSREQADLVVLAANKALEIAEHEACRAKA